MTMSSTSGATSKSPDHDTPLDSPANHSLIKSHQSVRKRVTPAQTAGVLPLPLKGNPNAHNNPSLYPRPKINPNLIYNEYKVHHNKGPLSWITRFRNFVAVICMISFPLGIFTVPLWLHTPKYPRVVVAISTTMERLDELESTVTSLMDKTLVPSISTIYVVVSKLDGEEIPAFLSDMAKLKPSSSRNQEDDNNQSEEKRPMFQLVLPKPDYGHSTVYATAIAALEAEQEWVDRSKAAQEKDATDVLITEHSILKETGDMDGRETRLIIWDDRFLELSSTAATLSSIETLVKASQAYPDAVLSFMGGNLRSHFRQIQQIGASNDESILLDKSPNVVLHSAPSSSSMMRRFDEVDVLDTTSGGVVFRVGRLLPEVPAFLARLQRLQSAFSTTTNEDDDSSDVIWEPDAGNVVWSGLLEAHNISRMLVPGSYKPSIFRGATTAAKTGNATSPSVLTMPSIIEPSRMHWMVAVLQLQVHWKIWRDHNFLDWSVLTATQLEAIECEGRYPQDCSTQAKSETALEGKEAGGGEHEEVESAATHNTDRTNNLCRPNTEYCGEYIEILESIISNREIK